MQQRVHINPSIAVCADIGPVSRRENVPIMFRNDDGPWSNDYDLKVWNSDKKNTEQDASEMLTLSSADTLTLEIRPEVFSSGTYYYEIYDRVIKRVLFKGCLTVVQ